MKKTLIIIAVILAVIVHSLVVYAAESSKADSFSQILTASDLVAAYKAGRLVPRNLTVSETYDDTGYYLRAKPSAKQAHALCLTLDTAIDASKINAVLIGYRTNYQTVSSGASNYIAADFPKDSTFNWQNCYVREMYDRFNMPTENGITEGKVIFSNINPRLVNAGAEEIEYLKITPWNGQALVIEDDTLISQLYADIEYLAFFESIPDAKSFDYDKYIDGKMKLPVYTITYLGKNGETITTEKAFDGMNCIPVTAPTIPYHDFTGWFFDNGSKVPSTFEVTKDITLKATYSYNETAYIKDKHANLIKEAQNNGLEYTNSPFIKGYDGYLFKPDNNMTRAEACTVITRLIVDENTIDNSMSTAFTDLSKNAWYYKYVTYLESLGYLNSYKDEFKPDQNITRAEFVELVYNMGKVQPSDKKIEFKDVPTTHERYDVIMAAASAGLVNGKTADTFDPDGIIKRSEVVKVICSALGRKPSSASYAELVITGFVDVKNSHWAYPYIISSAFEHKAVTVEGLEIWTSFNDQNDYFKKAPEGIVDTLNKKFDERVEKILTSESEWTVAHGGTVWYYSSSEGENVYDGKSASTPKKTLDRLLRAQEMGEIKAGDVVLFKRGDEWHGKFTCLAGVTYSAYGEGPKPRILGSVEADNASQWEETETKGIYKFNKKLDGHSQEVGNIVFNDGKAYGMKIINNNGTILKSGDNNIVSNGITKWKLIPREMTDYTILAELAKESPEADLMFHHDLSTNSLYLYSKNGNPCDMFESIELCTHGNAINAKSDVTIDNLCIKYTGSHGVGAGSCKNLTVRNCEIGWIGGSLQNSKTSTSTRYGNAVEIYGQGEDFYVYDNYMYQCYDCGPTIQWQGDLNGDIKVSKNIAFYGNALAEASLEVWYSTSSEPTENSYAQLINCRMYDNYVTLSGDITSFKKYNRPIVEYCAFYGGPQTRADYIECYIENNCFWNNSRHLMKAVPTTTNNKNGFNWVGNVIIFPKDEASIGYLGKDSANEPGSPVQYFYDKETVNKLVRNGTLGVNTFYYTPGDIANRRIATGIFG